MGRSARSLNRQGNSLYYKEMYTEALVKYKQAQATDPKNMIFDYNIGCASYKNDSLKVAANAFLKLISSYEKIEVKEKSYFNLGNTLFKGGELDAAIEAYKQVLRLNPNDIDAKINLELAQKTKEKQVKENQEKNEEYEGEKDGDKQEKQEQGKDEQEQKFSEEEAKSLLKAVEEEEKKTKEKSQKTRQEKAGVLRDW